jgi:hypothetical protein
VIIPETTIMEVIMPEGMINAGCGIGRQRRQETREWMLQRERASAAPSIVPDARCVGGAEREFARRAQAQLFAFTPLILAGGRLGKRDPSSPRG